jgi:GT2 family glycosyltransferase/glycosyltransferase involved in cell wall biosynthesis
MGNRKISVVIPAYNHENYVGETIQSVLDQTFQDFELIIINDGSTDHTEAEILKFKDERIRYYSQKNRGLSATLNRGIELAQGEFFNFLPSDDAFLPEKLATQLEVFEASKEIGVVFSYQLVVDGEGKEVKDDLIVDWFTVPFETKEEIFPALFERDFLSVPTALVRMECFKKVGLFDESLKTAQDFDMWLRILKYYDLRLIKRPLLRLRWHGANLTYRTTPETELERAKALLKAYRNLNIEDIFPELHRRGDRLAYAAAYGKLAAYMEKSGISALLPISQIYRDRGKHLTEKKGDVVLFKGEDQGEREEAFYQGGFGGDSTKIHLLVETRSLDKGGLEEVVYGIVTHLDPSLFSVVVVCIEAGGFTADRIRKAGIPVEVLGEEKEKEYIEILNRYRIDLVNAHYSLFGSAIASQRGIPVISVLHSIYSWYTGRILDEFRRGDKYVSKYITVSREVASFSTDRFNIDPKRVQVIPDGIEIGRFERKEIPEFSIRKKWGLHRDDFIFLHVGAVNPAKMHNLLVAAMEEISKTHPKVKLLCIGPILNEEYYHFIQKKIEERDLEQHMKIVGFVENPGPYYRCADAFVLPSLIEGWGIATLEAMYHGLPLILTKVGGAEELVKDQDIGILIDNCCPQVDQLTSSDWDYYSHLDSPLNAPQLIEAMLEIYRNQKEWKNKSKNGRKKVLARYTWDKIIPEYEKEFVTLALENTKRRQIRLIGSLRDQGTRLEEQERQLRDHMGEREALRKVIEDQTAVIQNQTQLTKNQGVRLGEQERGLEDQASMIQNQSELIRNQGVSLEEQERGLEDQRKVIQYQVELLGAHQVRLEEQEKRLGDSIKERESLSGVIEDQSKMIQNQAELSKLQQVQLEEQGRGLGDQRRVIEDQSRTIQDQVNLTRVQQMQMEEQGRKLEDQAKELGEKAKELEDQRRMIEAQSRTIETQSKMISEQLLLAHSGLRAIEDRLIYIIFRLSIKERVRGLIVRLKNRIKRLSRFRQSGHPKPREITDEPSLKEKVRGEEAFEEETPSPPGEAQIEKLESEERDKYGLERNGFSIICLPIIDWDFRFQRPQQILTRFAKDGHRVFYVKTQCTPKESRDLSKDELGDSLQIDQISENIYQVSLVSHHPLNIYQDVLEAKTDLEYLKWSIEILREKAGIENVLFYVNLPFWLPLVKLFSGEPDVKIVYDCMDYHPGFSTNTDQMVEQEENLSKLSDLVITSSQKLYRLQKRLNYRSILVRNGTDFNHFSRPEPKPLPEEIKKPVIGYYGAISDWFDMDLIKEVALSRPDWNCILIGRTFGANLDLIKGIPNIHLLGEKNYQELPGFLYHFDVCTIPFKLNELTEATNPVKVYEYLSTGKPVVTTKLPELEELTPYLYLAENPGDFVRQLEAALSEKDDDQRKKRIDFARRNDWANRYEMIDKEVKLLYEKVSIIVVSYNNLEYLKLCLQSIFEYSNYPNYEVIVVDNGSKDGCPEYLKEMEQGGKIKVILNSVNLGFARANNQGIQISSGEYIILLNDDTVVTHNWIGALLGYLSLPGVGMVGPVSNEVGNEAKIETAYASLDGMRKWATEYTRKNRNNYFEIKMLALFCVAFKRSLLDEIGVLDERFEIGMFEDDDFSLRVKKAGYKTICAEDVFIHHFGKISFKKMEGQEYQKLFDKNKELFESKWNIKWEPHRYREEKVFRAFKGESVERG